MKDYWEIATDDPVYAGWMTPEDIADVEDLAKRLVEVDKKDCKMNALPDENQIEILPLRLRQKMTTLRECFAPIIAKVLESTKDATIEERQKALRDAYIFWPRSYWPYKAWLCEIKWQLEKEERGV